MQKISVLDNDLKNITFQNCSISVLTGQDGYCFSVKDQQENRFMALQSYPGSEAYTASDVLNELGKFKETIWNKDADVPVSRLVFAVKDCMLLPKAFGSPEQLKSIVGFHYPAMAGKKILYTQFSGREYMLAGLVDAEMHAELKTKLNPKSVLLSPVALLDAAEKYTKNETKQAVYVQVWRDYAEMLAFSNDKPLLYNTTKYKTGNDLVYYILNLYKQLMLDPGKCPLMFAGFVEKNDTAVVQLNKFINHIFLETLNPDKNYSYTFQDTLPHYFVNFLNLD
jgi:hypothetical protein